MYNEESIGVDGGLLVVRGVFVEGLAIKWRLFTRRSSDGIDIR